MAAKMRLDHCRDASSLRQYRAAQNTMLPCNIMNSLWRVIALDNLQAGMRAIRSHAAAIAELLILKKEKTMLKATKAVAAAAGVMGVLVAGSVFADSVSKVDQGSKHEVMAPGRGLSLDIGGKHAVSYFETRNNACQLTVVMADVAGGEQGFDSPGTRFVIPVQAGNGVQLDTSAGQSAEFLCGPDASRMSARVFDRAPYKS